MSKPIKCIVLDGWHKGHVVDLPSPVHSLELYRPTVVTIDDCCDGDVVAEAPTNRHSYPLAACSVDRSTALYSTDGSLDSLWKNHDWIVPIDKNWLEQPLYVGIHDPRSVFEDSTPELPNKETK